VPKTIVVDHEKCTGCMMCAQACSLVKTGTVNPAAARIRILDRESSGITHPVLCQHCVEAVCVPACPQGAIGKDAKSGIVSIDHRLCVNCTICRAVCPYAAPVYSAAEKRVVLCDHCGGEPVCVSSCPTGALQYVAYEVDRPGPRLSAMAEIRVAVNGKERRG